MKVELFSDGACRGNPGPGGWGVILRAGEREREFWGGEARTTNNRMELQAVISGLQALRRDCEVHIVTDSQYVMKGVTEWMAGWKRRGWQTASKAPVKNRDLWEQLDRELARHRVTWEWTRGHSGHPDNERADALANRGIDEAPSA